MEINIRVSLEGMLLYEEHIITPPEKVEKPKKEFPLYTNQIDTGGRPLVYYYSQ